MFVSAAGLTPLAAEAALPRPKSVETRPSFAWTLPAKPTVTGWVMTRPGVGSRGSRLVGKGLARGSAKRRGKPIAVVSEGIDFQEQIFESQRTNLTTYAKEFRI